MRAVVGCSLIIDGATYCTGPTVDFSGGVIGASTALAGLLLLAGFMTPVISVVVILGGIARFLLLLPPPSNVDNGLTILNVVILAAALAFLGPGAFSLDARIFGRREIKIPSLIEHKS